MYLVSFLSSVKSEPRLWMDGLLNYRMSWMLDFRVGRCT